MTISKELFAFLKDLAKNNNRDWFAENKPVFQQHQVDVKLFFRSIEERLQETDEIEGHNVYRIYRDVRFSKDKTPYKARFSGGFKRATKALRGGYFLSIEPGNTFVGGGFYGPNKEDLLRIRKEFEMDDSEIRDILNNEKFKALFGSLQGSELKTAPRDFDPEHKAIDLIRKKQFYAGRYFTDKQVLSDDFANEVVDTFITLRPYFDFMSDVLTTDMNGVSII